MSTGISGRRLAWLDGELRDWQADGLLDPDNARAIRARYDASRRIPLTAIVFALGAAFVAVGLIWLVAANLDRIPPGVRMGAVLLLWLALVLGAEVLTRRHENTSDEDDRSLLVGAARLLAVAAFGACIFQAAQSLQVPAYTSSLLAYWAGGALLYAYAVNGLAPLLLSIGVGAVWFVWWAGEGSDSAHGFLAKVLLAAVLATAVAAVHAAGKDSPGPADGHWRTGFGSTWRILGALLALIGLFGAALPIHEDVELDVTSSGVVAGIVVLAALVGALVVSDRLTRTEMVVVAGVLLVAVALMRWTPPGDIAEPSAELTARVVLSVLAYLVVAGWYALLGVRRELPSLTWVATAALVVFTTVQSFAVFAPVISGATLFLAVGVVLIGVGLLAVRGRSRLVRLNRGRAATPPADTPPQDES